MSASGWFAIGLAPVLAMAFLTAAALVVYGVPLLVRRRGQADLARRCRESGCVVLTYDDGPGPTLTGEVLAALEAFDARATFFLLGMRAEASPEMVDRVREGRHELGSHSQRHLHAWKVAPWRSLRDMREGCETLERWLGASAPFRPPYGKWTLPTMLACRRRGAPVAWWTIDSGDTHDRMPDPAQVAARVASDGGGVVLLHDFDRDPDDEREERHAFVVATTRAVLETARERDLRVVTMAEALGAA